MYLFQILKKDDKTIVLPSDGTPVSITEVRMNFLALHYEMHYYDVEF